MSCPSPSGTIRPRIIIHGGAGTISRANLPPDLYHAHRAALLHILARTAARLSSSTALDAASYAVHLLELDPLYNAGRGAVFTTSGRIEHEASVMVSNGAGKRGCATVRTSRVKHPVLLAREMLVRGDQDGASSHNVLSGEALEGLAEKWGLQMERPSWFWNRKRWGQHRKGLGLEDDDEEWERERRRVDEEAGYAVEEAVEEKGVHWDGKEYLPQGTVGAVVLDRFGTICAATSTGGLTNKLPGRVGDTPTIGAGFWAESWIDELSRALQPTPSPLDHLVRGDWASFAYSMLPSWLVRLAGGDDRLYSQITDVEKGSESKPHHKQYRAVGMSGTGSGDSFLRICAARTTGAIARWKDGGMSLNRAVNAVAGPGGLLQTSAEDRWGKTGEGEGGIIGIELRHGKGSIVSNHNCGGMFRTWIDDEGKPQMMVFKEEYKL